ncbi:MAG: twin-arginine translocation signal domain-containing protein [Holophagae bacterium]|nr:twin-arginine translocation signal domain-containing protein [Holophagae bacterium]
MPNRREFLKASCVGVAGMTVAGNALALQTAVDLPKGLIYTMESPGKWSKKAKTHAPVVKVEGGKITITTPHPMTEVHYIVRHTLVSREGKVLGETTFKSSDKRAKSVFQLPSGRGKFYATSFCNQHDFWVTVFTV